MSTTNHVLEYKCPCCNAGLTFSGDVQQLKCEYCDNTFEIDAVKAFNEQLPEAQEFNWQPAEQKTWSEEEQENIQNYTCPSCGGELVTDANTAATFCPYCGNPNVMSGRVSDLLKPDAVLPFRTTKEDAQNAFLKLCKGKPLLPRFFTQEQQLEKITGMYVPFWLYDCSGDYTGSYKATRIRHWSDSRYHYTKTDHFMLKRRISADFDRIPMDASTKMDDTFMESIEPFDYGQLTDFDTAFLSGYLADKYDVPAENGEPRIRQRVNNAMEELLQNTLLGYDTVIPTSNNLNVQQGKASYVLLPVWILNTNYRGKRYTFAMNGQSGRMTGTLPVCPKRSAMWFAGIFAGVTLIASLAQLLFV
ncbi:MAG: hypothetical protein J6D13_01845 [Clostridium sp.]|nr:hypothetical protein [Clostridium sp.]